ncbi:hypothetical protein N825_31705 [Skermanella stibiiresistens SB22]|uniref:Uncharacterized protein n=1 Tax=Skermanella stibiiresistens SB22 TaxID=1385369 RepID=W9GQG6_9PROT|nr:hypothetical protein [Skermanella stibiiresistens]EWY36034.1 hypothetical protein N825_31705 [Skermanella stibiiresistens SB22]
MNKLYYGAAVLALALGVSGQAMAQNDTGMKTGQTDGATSGRAALGQGGVGAGDPTFQTGTTNVQVPASCGPTDIAAVQSDLSSVSNQMIRERLEVQLQTATNQYQDGNPGKCAQILADARNSIVKAGGSVNDISAAAGGGVVPPAGAGRAGSESVAGGGPVAGSTETRPMGSGMSGAMAGATTGSLAAGSGQSAIPQRYTVNDCQPTTWASLEDKADQVPQNRKGEFQQLLVQIQQQYNSGNQGQCAQSMNQLASILPGGSQAR